MFYTFIFTIIFFFIFEQLFAETDVENQLQDDRFGQSMTEAELHAVYFRSNKDQSKQLTRFNARKQLKLDNISFQPNSKETSWKRKKNVGTTRNKKRLKQQHGKSMSKGKDMLEVKKKRKNSMYERNKKGNVRNGRFQVKKMKLNKKKGERRKDTSKVKKERKRKNSIYERNEKRNVRNVRFQTKKIKFNKKKGERRKDILKVKNRKIAPKLR